ncbi:hypothetical protein K1719_012206 [Acacia pycnantha]|nr:hypothetical protein K1719_012206 [Acacia pycnantha]
MKVNLAGTRPWLNLAFDDYGLECSTSCSSSSRRHKYDVFLSFRGEDTRKSFTDHLYAALYGNGLITFRDEDELERGQVIKPSLLQAIEESFSAIVVVSKNYATSKWCLDELLKILDSKKLLGLHVFPIFYGVDPSDVRHQTGSFAKAFEEHEQKLAHGEVQRWRAALREVANLSGWSSQNWYETKLIEIVAETVRSKLDEHLDLNDEGVLKLVGIDAKIAEFESFLENTLEDVQFIGIWGMGGLGKTTLARVFYESARKNYEVHVFLENVRKEYEKHGGLISLQQKLLSRLKTIIKMEVGDCYEGRKLIKRRLCNRKVLLVLDDVSDKSQLENLAGKEGWFGKGSRIIMTTRDWCLLVQYGVSQYKMNFLSEAESRQLFLQKAFKEDEPNEDYLELSNTVVKSAKGLPLALEVFGSFLYGRRKSEWEDALRKVPPNDILEILKVSFDGLEYNEKSIFLDLACFFNGLPKNYVMQVLENSGLYPEIGVNVLIEKSLVTENEGCLRVHDMLQEMGMEIVFSKSPDDAGKRSRIWSLEDANHVLGNKKGTEAIRGIVIRFDKPYVIHLDPEAFSSMSNLKHGQMNLHRLNSLSSTLKVIRWGRYPLDFLPSQTQFNELIDLRMQHSKLKELWRGTQFLQSLKFIDLSHSTNLIRTPNFNTTPNLQGLILEGCTKLTEVHHSLGQHKNLVIVNFKDCKSIKSLPTKFEMNCLEKFILSGCSNVRKLPEFGKGMERLSVLHLENIAISKLPQSLVNLTGLSILKLQNCKNLVCFPSDFQKLKAIKKIDISSCSRFSRLPENLNENEALEELYIGRTAIKEVPPSLTNLKVLSIRGNNSYAPLSSSSTPSTFLSSPSFCNLSSLVKLSLRYCNLHDESLSSEIGNLSSLRTLDLGGNNFVEFPSGLISKLQKLEFLSVFDCPTLKSLSQLPSNLSTIYAGACPLLKHSVRPQLLWEFIEQFESQIQLRPTEDLSNGWKLHVLRDYKSVIISWDSQISLSQLPSNLSTIYAGACPSVRPQLLWEFIEQFESQIQLRPTEDLSNGWKLHVLRDYKSVIISWDSQIPDFFMQPTRLLVISGSEVPPWFHNQNYFCAEDFPYDMDPPTNVSFIVNKPDPFRLSEWWGIAVCLVLENDLESAKFKVGSLFWAYRVSEGRYSNSFRGCAISVVPSCSHQLCIIHIRFSSFLAKQLQLVFFTIKEKSRKTPALKIGKCGWRVLSKEDVERWQNTRDEDNNDEFIVKGDESISGVGPINSLGSITGTMGVGCGGVLRNEDGAFLVRFMHHIMEGDSFTA